MVNRLMLLGMLIIIGLMSALLLGSIAVTVRMIVGVASGPL